MENTSEMYIASKFKFLKHKLRVAPLSEIVSKPVSDEEKKKLEALEKLKAKELKKKQLADACKPGEKALKKKVFEAKEKYVNDTPVGERKDMSKPMLDTYDPAAVESAWDAWWTKQKLFEVTAEKAKTFPKEKRFVMLLPPPNVTGQLHLGHTLMGAIEDSLTRWKRMNGYCALWIPGTDHAGISCQTVVEKKILKEEGKYRKDFTREEFLKKVWAWKVEYGDKIFEQFRRLGVSFDWSRMYFTMDEERSKAVTAAFIKLFERGVLYRAKRIVHWCCTLRTAISDVELEEVEVNEIKGLKVPGYTKEVEFGVLIDFAYKLKKDPSKEIVVSTTRIETMLGDVAVAVHSKDPRYIDLHGELLIHPFFPDREVRIITDDILVDMAFGTGAVKITPGHDPNDFECGNRHNLPIITIIDEDGIINHNGGPFSGQKRYECRVKIQEELKKLGLYRDKKPNKMILQTCSKTGDIIEPMVKPQWWISCKQVADRGLEDVKTGKLKIIPEFQKSLWNHFLENIRDWCVSRQLWWGHQCPAFLVTVEGLQENPETHNNDHWVAAVNEQEAIEKAAEKYKVDKSKIKVKQDEDVLDTWFSSGLLPLSLCGWPDKKSEDFDLFFPSNVLETGHDIIFFWVARMVFFSYFFEDQLPYDTVYLHPIVRDAQGRKMSKSLGNVIDPLEVIDGIALEQILANLKMGNLPEKEVKKCETEKKKEFPEGIPQCGADALRIGLMSYMVQGRNINLDIQRVIGYRNFGKKLWNAANFFLKFALSKDAIFTPAIDSVLSDITQLSFIDKWILNKLSRLTLNFNKAFENYSFGDAVNSVYSFWMDCFCDVYIEAVKAVFKSNDEIAKEKTRNIMFYIMIQALKVLHPIAPFITEELYQRLNYEVYSKINPNTEIQSICISDFPNDSSFINDEIERLGSISEDLVHKILALTPQFTVKGAEKIAKPKDSKESKTEKPKEQQKDISKPKAPKLKVYLFSEDPVTHSFVDSQSVLISTLGKIEKIECIKDSSLISQLNALRVVFNENTDLYFDLVDFTYDTEKDLKRLNNELKEKLKLKSELQAKMTAQGYEENALDSVKKSNTEKMIKLNTEIDKLQACLPKN